MREDQPPARWREPQSIAGNTHVHSQAFRWRKQWTPYNRKHALLADRGSALFCASAVCDQLGPASATQKTLSYALRNYLLAFCGVAVRSSTCTAQRASIKTMPLLTFEHRPGPVRLQSVYCPCTYSAPFASFRLFATLLTSRALKYSSFPRSAVADVGHKPAQACSSIATTLDKKKEPSLRFGERRTLFHVWYHARWHTISAGQKSRTFADDFALHWSCVIEHDITRGTAFFSPQISGMVLFFVQGSRQLAVRFAPLGLRLSAKPPVCPFQIFLFMVSQVYATVGRCACR